VGYTLDRDLSVLVGGKRDAYLLAADSDEIDPIEFAMGQTSSPLRDFEPPPDVVDVWIDGDTGYRAGPGCPHVMQAAFIRKTEPRQVCPVFHPVVWPDSLGASWPTPRARRRRARRRGAGETA
jgi:hypothetical protein